MHKIKLQDTIAVGYGRYFLEDNKLKQAFVTPKAELKTITVLAYVDVKDAFEYLKKIEPSVPADCWGYIEQELLLAERITNA